MCIITVSRDSEFFERIDDALKYGNGIETKVEYVAQFSVAVMAAVVSKAIEAYAAAVTGVGGSEGATVARTVSGKTIVCRPRQQYRRGRQIIQKEFHFLFFSNEPHGSRNVCIHICKGCEYER